MDLDRFEPIFDILPEPQKTLWPELKSVPETFTLYGGTAIALQIGHRESIDFDFFGSKAFDPDTLLNSLPFLKNAEVSQRSENTLTVKVNRNGVVSLSFFGLPGISPVRPPDQDKR